MKALKKNINIAAVCVFEILVGIFLLVDPDAFTSAVIVIAGIVLMAAGLYSSVKYFKEDAVKASSGQLLMTGLSLLLSGAFCVFRSGWFVKTLPIITVIYGVVILAVGFCKVQISIDTVRTKNPRWYVFGISAVLSVICALVVFTNPFGTDALASLWTFTGIALVVLAVLDVCGLVLSKLPKKEKIELPVTAKEEEVENK